MEELEEWARDYYSSNIEQVIEEKRIFRGKNFRN